MLRGERGEEGEDLKEEENAESMKETEDDINPEENNIVTECHSVMINEE